MHNVLSREYLLLWDSTMANPNGDMLNDNRPRVDEKTGLFEVSDFRMKKYARIEWDLTGENVLVKLTYNEKGKVKSCTKRVEDIKNENKLQTDEEVIRFILENYIDARLFGCVITNPKRNFTGPLQITWTRSVNQGTIEFKQGTGAYASGEGKDNATIWSSYSCPYALFKTYMVFNKNTAIKNGGFVSEEDIQKFIDGLLDGMRNYRSTSKNQMPRLLIEVVYTNNKLDGELDCIDVIKEVEDTHLRNISQVTVDLTKLNNYYAAKKDSIKEVNLYVHSTVKLQHLDKSLNFNIHSI